MDDQITKKTEELISLIRNSRACLDYEQCLGAVRGQEDTFKKMQEYRRRTAFMFASGDPDHIREESARLNDRFRDILSDREVTDFLEAEQRLLKMMRALYQKLAEEIPLDLSHLDGRGNNGE